MNDATCIHQLTSTPLISANPRAKIYIVKRLCISEIPQDESLFFPWNKELFQYLKNLPGLINWKNTHSEFMGSTKAVAWMAGFESPEQIVGKNDDHMPWGENGYSELFRAEDQETQAGKILYILGQYHYHNRERLFFIKKMPIVKSDIIMGTLNHLVEIFPPTLRNVVATLGDSDLEISLELINNIRSVFFNRNFLLSKREEDCVYYLLKGLSAKEIAQKLNISYRTVEFYIKTLKEKLECNKTSSLIVKLLDLGYLDNIPTELLFQEYQNKLRI